MISMELRNPARASRNWANTSEFDSLVSRFFDEPFFTGAQTWAPTADVAETQNELKMYLDVPGMKKDDIKIELPGDQTLMIHGERKFEEQEGAKYTRRERFYGNFTRTFVLPSSVDMNKISATFNDGVLEIVLPKAESARARRIEVKS